MRGHGVPQPRYAFEVLLDKAAVLSVCGTILTYADFMDWRVYIGEKIAADLKAQRDALVQPGFFAGTPWASLQHLPRYLKALEAEFRNIIVRGAASGAGDDHLRVGPLKLFADGTLGSSTALLETPYEGTDNTGIAVTSSTLR